MHLVQRRETEAPSVQGCRKGIQDFKGSHARTSVLTHAGLRTPRVRGESTTKRKREKVKENKRIVGIKRKEGRKKSEQKREATWSYIKLDGSSYNALREANGSMCVFYLSVVLYFASDPGILGHIFYLSLIYFSALPAFSGLSLLFE